MKTALFATALIPIFFGCKKSTDNTIVSESGSVSWQLVQKNWYIGSTGGVLTPSKDSAVVLDFNSMGMYHAKLNGTTISQGLYSITTDANNYNQQILQLNDFKTTGIFSLFKVSELGTNGQVLNTFDGFFIRTSHDTLTLSGALTPGGSTSYIFVRR